MKRFKVYDNNGRSLDRYTIIDTKTGDVFGSSENPFHPQGFGQYAGNIIDWSNEYVADWNVRLKNKIIKKYCEDAYMNPDWLGHIVPHNMVLPIDVRKYIKQLSDE